MGFCGGAPETLQHRSLLPTIPCDQLSKEEAEHPNWKYCKTLYLRPQCAVSGIPKAISQVPVFPEAEEAQEGFFHTTPSTAHTEGC